MREDQDRNWYVYEETNRIEYISNGKCVSLGVEKNCVWYGVEYDYVADVDNAQLDCEFIAPRNMDIANPEKMLAKESSIYRYSVELESKQGKKAAPGYSVIEDLAEDIGIYQLKCSSDGKVIFDISYEIVSDEIDV